MLPAMTSAPAEIVYCARCATVMVTREVGGRPRRACPACRYIHFVEPKVGVGTLVQDDRGRVLLVRRAVPPEQGKWALPAGYVDPDEHPRLAAARETLEETGLVVEIRSLVEVYHNPPARGGAAIFILYRAVMTGGVLAAADDVSEAEFFALDRLPEGLAFASTRDILQRLRVD